MNRDSIEKLVPHALAPFLRVPALTNLRRGVALATAVVVDGIQLLIGPLGWSGVDQILDLAAMAATSYALGFHPLLLPTFVIELLPVVDALPTWTGCVALVIALRNREQSRGAVPPTRFPPPASS